MAYLRGFGGWSIHVWDGDTPMSEFHIDKILNRDSLKYLDANHPGLIAEIRLDLAENKTPEEIFNRVNQSQERRRIAVRIRQAAYAILDGE